jgi:hypothetical protein
MGVPHSGELAYVWSYSYLTFNPEIRADCGIELDVVGWTPEDDKFAEYVNTLWTNFFKFSNPTPVPVPAPLDPTMMTTWPKFSVDDKRKVLNIDFDIHIDEDYRQRDYEFYTYYLQYLTGKDLYKKKPINRVPKEPTLGLKSTMYTDLITKLAARMMDQFGIPYDDILEDVPTDYEF